MVGIGQLPPNIYVLNSLFESEPVSLSPSLTLSLTRHTPCVKATCICMSELVKADMNGRQQWRKSTDGCGWAGGGDQRNKIHSQAGSGQKRWRVIHCLCFLPLRPVGGDHTLFLLQCSAAVIPDTLA